MIPLKRKIAMAKVIEILNMKKYCRLAPDHLQYTNVWRYSKELEQWLTDRKIPFEIREGAKGIGDTRELLK